MSTLPFSKLGRAAPRLTAPGAALGAELGSTVNGATGSDVVWLSQP